MPYSLFRTLIKIVLASLIVGTILTHFGITAEHLVREFGLSFERIEEVARNGVAWAMPNLMVGAIVILPIWFLLYLFRPPSRSGERHD
jgi:hypothetical protein